MAATLIAVGPRAVEAAGHLGTKFLTHGQLYKLDDMAPDPKSGLWGSLWVKFGGEKSSACCASMSHRIQYCCHLPHFQNSRPAIMASWSRFSLRADFFTSLG